MHYVRSYEEDVQDGKKRMENRFRVFCIESPEPLDFDPSVETDSPGDIMASCVNRDLIPPGSKARVGLFALPLDPSPCSWNPTKTRDSDMRGPFRTFRLLRTRGTGVP